MQAVARGHIVRRIQASVVVEKYYRCYVAAKRYKKIISMILSLQCRTRENIAKKVLFELKKEQKDVGKLKQNNEKLKEEMASLRAMLAAQAKQGAADSAHTKEMAIKEKQIADLEKRIAEIEKELDAAKQLVEKLEAQVKKQQEESTADRETIKNLQNRRTTAMPLRSGSFMEAPPSPGSRRKRNISGDSGVGFGLAPLPPGVPADYVSPEVLAMHRAKVATLEEELDAERRFRREADGEIIKLRAKVNGVELDDADVNDLLAQRLDTPRSMKSDTMSEDSSFAEEPSTRMRYIFVVLVALLFECFCIVFLLRRRSFLLLSLELLAGIPDEFNAEGMPNRTSGSDWLPLDGAFPAIHLEMFQTHS
jgi:uncharacterized protein YukE